MKTPKALKNFKRYFKKAAIGMAAVFATAAAVEFTGYSAFDKENGDNFLARIDPTCRSLTEDEIALSREVFGDAIDYSTVKIFNRPWFGVSLDLFDRKGENGLVYGVQAISPNGNVYFNSGDYREDFTKDDWKSKTLFLHEMTHVYQKHNGENVILKSLTEERKNGRAIYYKNIEDVDDFKNLTIEQQASLIENYYTTLKSYESRPTKSRKNFLAHHMAALTPYFETVRQYKNKLGISIQDRKAMNFDGTIKQKAEPLSLAKGPKHLPR